MKRFLSITLASIIVLSSLPTFASMNMETKLENHWSKDIIKKDFVAYYFPYLARNGFEKFNPDEDISQKDFSLSLGSLSKEYNLKSITNHIIYSTPLNRTEIARIIGKTLLKVEDITAGKAELPFKDINTMDSESIELLKLLYNLNIINGVSSDRFAPEKTVSKAEAIVILSRVKGALEDMKEVSFEVKGVVQSYNSEENVIIKEKENNILLTITKQFGTPGYSLGVEKIIREEGSYKVLLDIRPPSKDAILPQVITYKTITVEIQKEELKGEAPYVFTVEGIKGSLFQ